MQVSKILPVGVSIYDKSGMIRVNPMTKDFAATPNGNPLKRQGGSKNVSHDHDHDFEDELSEAMERISKNSIDYRA